MTPERHIWTCANALMQENGNDAWFHASQRADALHDTGDVKGQAMFKSVLRRIEELEQIVPTGPVH